MIIAKSSKIIYTIKYMQYGIGAKRRMYLKELNVKEFTTIYQTYMTDDFPPDELKPLERMIHTMETGLCCAFGLYENDDLRAYAVFIVPEGQLYGLLDYLAVVKQYRGTGVGHHFFALIEDALKQKYTWLDGFFIESENIDFAGNEQEQIIRRRRIAFYENNNCQITKLGSRLFGVTYSILLYRFASNTTIELEKEKLLDALDKVYIAMFKKHHYDNEVSLWVVD
jgi:hypothetical protein